MDEGQEPPKKPRVKDLGQLLDRWAKEKVPKTVSEYCQKSLADLEKKSEEETLKDFRKKFETFIKKTSNVPEEFKHQIAIVIGTKELDQTTSTKSTTENPKQETSGATGNATGNTTEKQKFDSHQTSTNKEDEKDQGPEKTDVPKPKASNASPSASPQINKKQEKDIEKLKKALEEEKKHHEEQKRKADQRAAELKELNEQKERESKESKHKFDELNKSYQEKLRELKDREKMAQNMETQVNKYATDEIEYKANIERLTKENFKLTQENQAYKEEIGELFKERHALEKKEKTLNREIEALKGAMADEKRKNDDNIQKLIKERDDLRDRFSKVAGAKLSDENSDIADLSDPNRAMKLSEKFGQLYDDEWTNAFEALTDDKMGMHHKEAIKMLLNFLKDCLGFCETVKKSQLDILNNVFLHPIQNSKIAASEGMQGIRERPRIASKEEKTLRELRRQITVQPGIIEEVKQAFIVEVKTWEKKGVEKKHVEACITYLQKCAELCWLIALHEPPLFVKFDFKPGEKFDQNVYSVYSTSGNQMDFLVWPPLYNGENGGLLSKGTAEPIKSVKKGK